MKNKSKASKEYLSLACDFIKSQVGINLCNYSRKSILIVVVVLFLGVSGGLRALYFSSGSDVNIGNKTSSAEGIANIVQTGNNSPVNITNIISNKRDKLIFKSSNWEDTEGDLASYRKKLNRLLLPLKSTSGLIKYKDPISANSFYEISFVPLSDDVINFVITIPQIFEIVIGDEDFRTVSLKYSSVVGEPPNVYVLEMNTQKSRSPLDYEIEKNREVEINVKHEILTDGSFLIQLDIQYWPKDNFKKKLPQSFVYAFKPSPAIEDSLYLNLGLIRSAIDAGGYIAIDLVKPSI